MILYIEEVRQHDVKRTSVFKLSDLAQIAQHACMEQLDMLHYHTTSLRLKQHLDLLAI